MEQIGTIADRVLGKMAARQIEMESILKSIESSLLSKDYPAVRKLSQGIFNEARGRMFELWLKYPPVDSKIFAETETTWKELKETYNGTLGVWYMVTFQRMKKYWRLFYKLKRDWKK